jgi:putative endonuclease
VPVSTSPSTYRKGQVAEALAAQYLQRKGYRILRHNVRTPFGEIDLLAWKKGEFIVVEVRSRAKKSWISPELTITPQKYSRIVRSLLCLPYLHNKPTRIDVITIIGERVKRHFKAVEYPAN